MNTGTPAVSGEGAMGVIEVIGADVKATPLPMPVNWPRDRVPTPEEWDRIEEARRRRDALMRDWAKQDELAW